MNVKNALVTGASNGIGRETALELGRLGYNVGVNYYSDKKSAVKICEELEKMGVKAVPLYANLGKMEELLSMFEAFYSHFQTIDLLVNNAGMSSEAYFLDTTEEFFDLLNQVNWKGAYFSAQQAAKQMVAKETKGVIVNISSNQTDGTWPRASVYAPIKSAIGKFTESISMELAPYGIRVVCVAPGYTLIDSWKDKSANEQIWDAEQKLPLRRFAKPEEIAKAIAFLASDDAAYITGTTLRVDGGATLPVVAANDFVTSEPIDHHA